jgi:hypothetical protein
VADKVQFREDADVLAFVESQGVNPNELARELFEAEVRRMKAKRRREKLNARPIRLGFDPVAAIREDRDSR